MSKRPKLYRKRKGRNGPYVGNYLCKVDGAEVNLKTKLLDGPDGAVARSEQAVNGRRDFKSDADQVVANMEQLSPAPAAAEGKQTSHAPPELEPAIGTIVPNPAPAPAAAAAPPAPAPLRLLPPVDQAAEAAGTAAAAEETAGDAGDAGPAPDPEVSLDEIAELAVGAQVWVAAEYARSKVYRGFATPQLADETKKPLVEQWKKIAQYSGAAVLLPPWVTQLAIPGAIIIASTLSMARAFAEVARTEKAAAASSPADATTGDRAAA